MMRSRGSLAFQGNRTCPWRTYNSFSSSSSSFFSSPTSSSLSTESNRSSSNTIITGIGNNMNPNKNTNNKNKSFGTDGTSSPFVKHLMARIQTTGPLTIADYMKECLYNPLHGYYMRKDVFGEHGDFITSPEISQIFGEMLGVWFVAQWEAMGRPSPVQLVELGPGRGLMMRDILRTLQKFPALASSLSVHFVETSPRLSGVQAENVSLKGSVSDYDAIMASQEFKTLSLKELSKVGLGGFKSARAIFGGNSITWHNSLDQVPIFGHTLLVAHELFDALPHHQLILTHDGWRERLVDIDESQNAPFPFRFVASKSATPASSSLRFFGLDENNEKALKMKRLQQGSNMAVLKEIELSPDYWTICSSIKNRLISPFGGSALIVDYGSENIATDTFRAFRQHKQVHVFDAPGTSDLTFDVNFSHIRKALVPGVSVHGPISQGKFLKAMGIERRLEALIDKASHQQVNQLKGEVARLVEDMGTRFQVMAATHPPSSAHSPSHSHSSSSS